MPDLEALVRHWFAAVQDGAFEALLAMYVPGCADIRSNGTVEGPKTMVARLGSMVAAFPDRQCRIDAVLVAGAAVTVECTETGTHTQPFFASARRTILPTGLRFEVKLVDVFRFEGVKIASQHEYFDRLSVLGQLGWLDADFVEPVMN